MAKEMKYYGVHACLALASARPKDIIRVYLDASNVQKFSRLLKWCSMHKKAYHIVPMADLDRITDSVHHEGICVLANELPILSEAPLPHTLPQKCALLYLDGVENPHNLGAILRTASHFGVPYVLGNALSFPPSAYRIAKGGAEVVKLVSLKRPLEALVSLKKQGFALVATSAHRGASLYNFAFPNRTIFIIGSESKGVRDALFKQASSLIRIPGTGAVESLNVSVATSLCMGEFFRQHGI